VEGLVAAVPGVSLSLTPGYLRRTAPRFEALPGMSEAGRATGIICQGFHRTVKNTG
jgi:hypothetical protein